MHGGFKLSFTLERIEVLSSTSFKNMTDSGLSMQRIDLIIECGDCPLIIDFNFSKKL